MSRILVVAPAWIGDAVMAQPLLARLAEGAPGTRIDVLAPAWTFPVFRRMPQVADTLDSPFGHGQVDLRGRLRLARQIAARRYDRAVVLPNSLKSALVPFLARIPVRTGYRGEMRYRLLNDARMLDKRALPLMVERFAWLAQDAREPLRRPVPHPRLQADPAQARGTAGAFGIAADRPLAAFCPGAEYGPAKRWPASHFAELARRVSDQGRQVILLGSAKDSAIGDEIARLSEGAARNLCGVTTLDQAVDLLACAGLVVTNDSGLMHVAAALDRPLAALFGSSSPAFTPPLSERARVMSLHLECSPCFRRECPLGHLKCLQELTPAMVLEALP